jgi:hypothetical protein
MITHYKNDMISLQGACKARTIDSSSGDGIVCSALLCESVGIWCVLFCVL